jgi:hypothetical protein
MLIESEIFYQCMVYERILRWTHRILWILLAIALPCGNDFLLRFYH